MKTINEISLKSNNFWTDSELRVSVLLYLQLLKGSLIGNHIQIQQEVLNLHEKFLHRRTLWAVQRRMQNISSVLYQMKKPYLEDFSPAHNVGTGVKARIIDLLYECGLSKFEMYAHTNARNIFEGRVSTLRRHDVKLFPKGIYSPVWEYKEIKAYFRDPAVKAWVLKESGGVCEGCHSPASFIGLDGMPYLEVHHVIPLAENGSDRISNTVALCPNCHMRCHYSADRDEFRLRLYQSVKRLNIEVPDPR